MGRCPLLFMAHQNLMLEGLAVAPGVAVGRAVLVDGHSGLLSVDERIIPEEDLEFEVKRFLAAVETSRKQLSKIQRQMEESLDAKHAQIFTAQAIFLDDDSLIADTVGEIRREQRNGDYLLHRKVSELVGRLMACEDEFFRARNNDVLDVTNRVLSNLAAQPDRSRPQTYPADAIIVANDLAPSQTAQMFKNTVQAMVLEKGGLTSHTAILSKALGIPCLVGVAGIVGKVRTGDPIIVDGIRGTVIVNPDREAIEGALRDRASWAEEIRQLEPLRDQPAITPDGIEVTLRANVELPLEVEHIFRHGAEGIGLFRTEFLFMNRSEPPNEDEQYAIYKDVLERTEGKSVTFRTLDFGGDKLPFAGISHEANPFMGVRAIRLCLARRHILRDQLRALLRASAHGNLQILVPMISGLEEVFEVRRELKWCEQELVARGETFAQDIPLGIMIEIPSAAVMADQLAQHCDFFSIGSNDLVQYTLAVDRGNEGVAYLFDPWHPAVLRLIQMTIQAARRNEISCSICGEVAADPAFAAFLIGLGFRELSMTATCIPRVKSLIRGLPAANADRMAAAVMECHTIADVKRAVDTFLAGYYHSTRHPDIEALTT
jgi:phosphotransferase system enzyme I (PtsI)